ncbi:MAG: cytochrome P450 [Actinomycetota bacterium]|nr:cytochrome P450 [Actinomycetota bacterium]
MTDVINDPQPFRNNAPLQLDRAVGWDYFTAPGEVYERDGAYYLTSIEAIRFAHQHPEVFSSAKAFDSLGSPVPLIPIAIDPPQQIRYRRILDPMFAPRVVTPLEPELRRQVREIIEAFAAKGECEVIRDLGSLYPTGVILTLFGMPLKDRDTFIEWSEAIIETSGKNAASDMSQAQMEAAMNLFGYLQGYITEKRANPGNDSLSAVLALSGDDAWTDEEVLGLCFLFVIAGLDTVTAAISYLMYHLAIRPDLQRAIKETPDLGAKVIEEVLRLELPAPLTPRVTLSDTEVCGVKIPAGAFTFLVLGAANREDRPIPDDIDVENADRGHLTFGGGVHRCMGSHLARRELKLMLEEFLALIPEFSLAPGTQPVCKWPGGTLHLESVNLVWNTGAAQ